MHYINQQDIESIDYSWHDCVDVIEQAIHCLQDQEFAQPIKPYLRYKDPVNRIIAMPAYIGGKFQKAGIKWIASFPGNIDQGIPRAHSVVILNDSDTGQPQAVINTPMLSTIRTAAVTGLFIRRHQDARPRKGLRLAILGWGPIGKTHFDMCREILKGQIESVQLYDIRPIDRSTIPEVPFPVKVADSWEEAYQHADVFMTCTVADKPYIDKAPKPGSLHLNVSLRDYTTDTYDYFKDAMFVDDWDEVCREATDVENLHIEKGLQREDTYNLDDLIHTDVLQQLPAETPVLFNPMGMAIFDIAVGTYFLDRVKTEQVGTLLAS
ncbi:MAG: 2,3-diaminopropionate biosynthesis protein SbnB [Bacteroidota bacterium]